MNKPSLSSINSDLVRAEKELKFSIRCKNNGQIYLYNLSNRKYYKDNPKISRIISYAIYKLRNKHGHRSRISVIEGFQYFLRFLSDCNIYNPNELSSTTLVNFSEWLKINSGLKYSTAGSIYRKLSPVFIVMNTHKSIKSEFIPQRNSFRRSTSLSTLDLGYSQNEYKKILKLTTKLLRENRQKLEKEYQPKWLGKPAPIDDVAPETGNGMRSKWMSSEYRLWWWENNCGHEKLTKNDIYKIHKGESFIKYINLHYGNAANSLQQFYIDNNIKEGYKPKYLGEDPPIKYITPWKKMDYMIWYWENNMNFKALSTKECKKHHKSFYRALREHHKGTLKGFFGDVGKYRWISRIELGPYFLMLLIRTGLNPSTLAGLTIDCIKVDPLNKDKVSIDWTKHRSHKKDKTIPVSSEGDSWPALIIQRVINITSSIRKDEKELWLTNSNPQRENRALSSRGFQSYFKEISKEYNLKKDDNSNLSIQAKLIRPTTAWNEYLRTEDLNYLKSLLGHKKVTTTSDYLRRIEDPIFLNNRSIHQEALFKNLISHKELKNQGIKENTLNHCKDPLTPPSNLAKSGGKCASPHDVCLSCQNLVITPRDIKKYFCYINFYTYLFETGDIPEEEYEKLTSHKVFTWETHILPKYPTELIEKIRIDAVKNPVKEWSIKSYEPPKS